MQLALHIELTDEQYEELMKKSAEELFNNAEIKQAMVQAIAKEIGPYLQTHTSYIDDFLKPGYYQSDSEKHRSIVKELFTNATEEYQKSVSEAVTDHMKKLIANLNINDIVIAILHDNIVTALQYGIQDVMSSQVQALWNSVAQTSQDIGDLKQKLMNINQGY